MEGNTKGDDFYRPTAPAKGHLKRSARQEGWPGSTGSRDDRQFFISPPPQSSSLKRSYDEYDKHDKYDGEDESVSKPPYLGGYRVQRTHSASPGPEHKIRGIGPPKTEGYDEEFYAAPFSNFQKVFQPAMANILAQAENINQGMIKAHLTSTHPGYRFTAKIKSQLDRLTDVYSPMVAEVEGMEVALKDFASREDELNRDLADAKSTAFELSCAREELSRFASREEGLKRNLEECKENAFKLECANKELSEYASREKALKRDLNDLKAVHYKLTQTKKKLVELASREGRLGRDLSDAQETIHNLTETIKELNGRVEGFKATAAETETELHQLRCEVENLDTKHRHLESSHQELQSERVIMLAEKLYLERAVRERDADVENSASENLRLQTLVQEREAELEKTKIDVLRLQGFIRDREEELEALPITPLSPLAPFSARGAPMHFPLHTRHTVPPSSDPPAPYIKQEVPDQTPSTVGITPSTPVEQPQDPAQQLSQLEAGLVDILGKAFHISRPDGYNDAIVSFISRLGAAPEPSQINVIQSTSFWQVQNSWTTNPATRTELRPTLEERFAHLLLLFPPQNITPAQTLTAFDILTSLITADHSLSPRAGLAFLQTMSTYHLPTTTSTPEEPLTTTTTLLSILLCELCRALQHTFPSGPPTRPWTISGILGPEAHDTVAKLPLGRLAAALAESDRSETTLKARLTASCGDKFCSFAQPDGGGEMGLLYCDEGRFLMVDFEGRGLRMVECGLADMERNAGERRKWDLSVVGGEGEVLFRLEAAPGEVAAFWVQWVYG